MLGPVLFLTYINDIATDIYSQLWLFADDCLIYRTIWSVDDHHILQEDLDTLASRARTFNMEFNIPKCDSYTPSHNSFQ